MVKTRSSHFIMEDGHVDPDAWLSVLEERFGALENRDALRTACEFVNKAQSMALDESAVQQNEHPWRSEIHPLYVGLEMVEILLSLRVGGDALLAALIYRSVRENLIELSTVKKSFGTTVVGLIDGVKRMAVITSALDPERKLKLSHQESPLERLRKMLVSMIDDVRVALIKLAERTCAIRAVKDADEHRKQQVAREVFEIYAPLAHRLGIGHIKWELEDLSFRYLHPAAYKHIAKLLDEKRIDRDRYIADVVNVLSAELKKNDIEADISGRAKHIYSIWRKMKRKNLDFNQIYDVRAFRMLVPTVRDCYAALGVVHSIWQHIPKEFDDYIAMPKENDYQSLHTAVLGPEGKVIEVQIRTMAMHENAEFGVCSHWRYKGTDTKATSQSYENKIAWLRQVLEWQEDLGEVSAEGLLTELNTQVQDNRVYVFTRDGDVLDLVHGSTPIDFAYRVHTDVGHRCRGAKINGRIVPLTYVLETGDQVDIMTAKELRPSRDWLNPENGYVYTSRARAKIQLWFKLQAREDNIDAGQQMLDRELKRLMLLPPALDKIAQRLNLKLAEDVLAGLGAGDIRLSQVVNQIQKLTPQELDLDEADELKPVAARSVYVGSDEINVDGLNNILTHIAKCCKPLPGDEVSGFVSIGRGVVVHQTDCREFQKLQHDSPERVVAVNWTGQAERFYSVDVLVDAYDRPGLLRDITHILANEGVNVTAASTKTNRSEYTARIRVTVEINDLVKLGKILSRISSLPNVIEARRLSETNPI